MSAHGSPGQRFRCQNVGEGTQTAAMDAGFARHEGFGASGLADLAPVVVPPRPLADGSSGCLHERFAAQARRTPDAIAVSCGDERLTYAELDAAANRLARRLRREGVGPEVPVGVLLERSAATLTALVAVVKAGGAYLPLDTAHPAERMAYTLGDARARVLITEQRLVERVDARAAGVRTVLLDAEADAIAAEDPSAPHSGAVPENLAYVLYTSGSTGQPKGVAITHANATGLFTATVEWFALGPDDVWTIFHSFAFDFSVWETWGPLLHGSRAVVVPYLTSRSPEAFLELLRRERVTVLSQTPSAFLPLAAAAAVLPPDAEPLALRLVVFDGEPLRPGSLRGWVERHGDARPRLVNMYGITETTVHVTWRDITARDVEAGAESPIGVPVPGLSTYLLDPGLEPVPQGAPGEIYVGGYGVGRGYLIRPALTAERFLPDPYAGVRGARMYRSGDIARGTADGGMDYLRRGDHQVKVRGFRIELGEVENTIARHPGVRASVVVVREGGDGEGALVAYVVPSPASGKGEEVAEERVEDWARTYEKLYGQDGGGRDPEFDIIGWNSSYSGEPIGAEQMREQVEGTVERIRGLGGARVLEIGCGTGLLLLRLAEGCARYVGTDFSPSALEGLGRAVGRRGWNQVELWNRRADDFAGIEPGSLDVVVLNSVVQYFPDVGYLLRVLEGAARAVRPGGFVWVGDVRNLRTMPMLHAGVELVRGAAGTPAGELRARLRRRAAEEVELLLDPELFHALPGRLDGVSAAAVLARPGHHRNEITRHRYDAVLQVGGGAPSPAFSERAWEEAGGLDGVREALAAAPGAPLLVRGVPSAPLAGERRFLEHVEGAAETEPVQAPAAPGDAGVEPEVLRELARAARMEARVHWSRETAGAYDVAFVPGGAPLAAPLPGPPADDAPWSAWASVPLARSAEERLADSLREHLRRTLPEHMVPSAFVRMDELPLTSSGKVDLRALPDPGTRRGSVAFVAPRNRIEEQVAGIWRDVLRLDRVGVNDNFFNLGGHSLRAGRVVSQVRHRMGIEVQLGDIFDRPVLADFARGLEAPARTELLPIKPVVPVPRGEALPLSFAQERLWFLDRLKPGSAFYNVLTALRLGGALNVPALELALGEMVRRHEVLRTTFREADSGPEQVIASFTGFRLPVEELSGLEEAEREAALRRRAAEEAARPFDLAAGPVFRVALLRLGEKEHALLLCLHHIVIDEWSLGVFFRELSALYGAYREGRESPLPEPALQYADYAVWQREHLPGAVLEGQLAWWKDRLASAPALLELPLDRSRPPVQTYRGARERFALPAELLERLRALARGEGATLYMVLLGAFQVLLGKYGVDDVVVGSPIAGRTQSEVEELIGFFVNTLVLRTDLGGDPDFRELLGRVREVSLQAYKHQEVPFEALVAELQPERSLSHSPLIQVMFVLEEAEDREGVLPGLSAAEVEVESGAARFDLTLRLVPAPDGLWGRMEYATDLFERATVQRMLGHLERVLEQVASRPGTRLTELELLSGAERRQVVEQWNATDAAFPAHVTVHELLEAQAGRTPHAVAVEYEGRALSYAELNARANRVAHHLGGLGVGPDTRVGICVERSLEMMVGLFAILKSGGAYVPLDPAYPADRLHWMLEDSAPAAVLTQRAVAGALAGVFAETAVPLVELDAADPAWAACPETDPVTLPGAARHVAYVIYTSGSTGRPKGVMVEHRSVVNVLTWMQEAFRLEAHEAVLQKTPISFDAAARELYSPMMCGARLVVARPGGHRDPDYLVETVRRAGITSLHFVPPMLAAFLEHEEAARCTGLRRIVCGGQALPSALARRTRELLPETALWNVYGPTEATVDVAAWRCTGGESRVHVPIGRPMANVRAYVLDQGGAPVPAGVPGELFLGGVQVARGYLNRPGLTAERFVADPFSAGPDARLYRTGDLARWLADGSIEYLGRNDFQVKVRGHRIELGEIEARLATYPGVREAVAAVREDGPGGARLVAYYVAAEAIRPETLRAYLAAGLPGHMVPTASVRLSALPLTPNGKLDRRALPAPDGDSFATRGHEPPLGEVEEVLAAIWGELLGVERVGRHDSFFELGGHSLLATRLAFRMSRALGLRVPAAVLFEPWSLRELARWVNEQRAEEAGGGPPPLVRAPRDRPLPLTLLQEFYWMQQQIHPGLTSGNSLYALRLRGALGVPVLERALTELVRRHEALRTTFPTLRGVPMQRVAEPEPMRIPMVELSRLPPAAREAEALRLANGQALLPFSLERGPLLRMTLVRLGAREWVLLATVHHIVSDGWSKDVMVRDLGALYGAFVRGEPPALPEPEAQYGDYAVWQRGWMKGEVLERHAAYWRERLTGARPIDLAGEGAGRAGAVPRRTLTFDTVAAPLGALRRLCGQEGATLLMVMLASFEALLVRYTGQTDLTVETALAGRSHPELAGTLGCFAQMALLRTNLSGDPTLREAVRRVRETTLGAYANQELPLFERLGPGVARETEGYQRLRRMAFSFQESGAEDLVLAGLEVEPLGGGESMPPGFQDGFVLAESDGVLRGAFIYRVELYPEALVQRAVRHFLEVLDQVAADPELRISALVLSAEPAAADPLRTSIPALAIALPIEPAAAG